MTIYGVIADIEHADNTAQTINARRWADDRH